MERFRQFRHRWQELRRTVRRRPLQALNPHERRVRWLLDMARLAWMRLHRNRAGFVAAALSFRLLFSLMPLLALAAVVARYSVSEASFLEAVDEFIASTGLDGVSVQAGEGRAALGDWLRDQAAAAMKVNPASLGLLGALFLAWSGLRLFDEVEAAFSALTGGTKRRSIKARVCMSVGLLVLLPGAATLGLEVISHALNLLPGVLGGVLQWIVALGVLTALVTMIFHWYPVQGPSWRASAFGAAFAGVAIAVGEWVLRTYVFKAVPSSPLGGALGLVPLVMLWVYVMWLCLLYGLELAVLIDRGRDQWRQRVRVTDADARPPTTAG